MRPMLYLAVEFQRPRSGWTCFLRLADAGAMPELERLLQAPSETALRGLPSDVSPNTLSEDSFCVDAEDELSDEIRSAVSEVAGVRLCSRARADAWLRSGSARMFNDGWNVTDPEAHSHSWLSAAEFLALSARCDDQRELPHVKAISSALSSLAQSNLNARIVYWFA
jgi:hypothetical protein